MKCPLWVNRVRLVVRLHLLEEEEEQQQEREECLLQMTEADRQLLTNCKDVVAHEICLQLIHMPRHVRWTTCYGQRNSTIFSAHST